jgi:hypothetical protein
MTYLLHMVRADGQGCSRWIRITFKSNALGNVVGLPQR